MADKFSDYLLDNGLTVLDTVANVLHMCSGDPTDYADMLTKSLGNKAVAAGALVGAPAVATPNGQKVTTINITDGAITTSGTATKWAIGDSAASRLLCNGSLVAPVSFVSGTFSLPPFVISFPNQGP
jgi:hypothetical protein